MDHDMQAMAGMAAMEHAPGTFAGHVIPGAMLLLLAGLWLVELWRSRGERRADAPLETLSFVPPLKVVLPLLGVGIEWPGPGWDAIDRVMNFQHVSMYGFFALSGVVDLL